MNLVAATLKSDNTVYAQLDLDVGPEEGRQDRHDMGITSTLDGYPAEGLGGLEYGVSPLEMANAYATIASGGWRTSPTRSRGRFPDGDVETCPSPSASRSSLRRRCLRGHEDPRAERPAAAPAPAAQIGCPAAGKTGTTDDYTDAWFVGFTPKLATAVWVGYPKGRIPMRTCTASPVDGGTFPAQIWGHYMKAARRGSAATSRSPTMPFESQAVLRQVRPHGAYEQRRSRSTTNNARRPAQPTAARHRRRRRARGGARRRWRPPTPAPPTGAGDRPATLDDRRRPTSPAGTPTAGTEDATAPNRRARAATLARPWQKKKKSNSRARSSRPCRTRCSA